MRKQSFLASAAVAAALMAPGAASAGAEYFDFSGSVTCFGCTTPGTIEGEFVVDVVSGVAVSGAGSIEGTYIPGVQTLTLITPSTPGSGGYPSGIGWRDGSGTDTWGWDNLVPIDYVGGLDFSFGAGTSLRSRARAGSSASGTTVGPSDTGMIIRRGSPAQTAGQATTMAIRAP